MEVLEAIKPFDGILCVHCENGTLVNELQRRVLAEGITGPEGHPLSRPAECEAEAISRLMYLSELTGARVNVVHCSTRLGLEQVRAARERGVRVSLETCPQYLALDDGVYYGANWSMAARYVCAPPIRAEENQRALWRGLRRGEIQTISTDHCSFTLAQKDAGRGDFTKIPGGMPGVETRGTLLFTYGVAAGRITAERMADVLAETPAKLYGLFPRKGVLQPGADADIVVYDPRGTSCITAADQAANVDYAPYEGTQIAGHIAEVYLRGTCVVREGKILHDRNGQYLHRGKCML